MKPDQTPTPRFEGVGEDSGNGSLMRLAPIPLFFAHHNQEVCLDAARCGS